jgi:large subunit ribosomal protein L22
MAEENKDTEKKTPAKKPARKPAAKKPAASKAAEKKPKEGAAEKAPASKKPAARKPAAKKPVAETKPATKKRAAKKPAAKPKEGASTKTAATKTAAESTAKKPAAKPKAKEKPVERPVVNARARFVRLAPRKARLVADQVRGMPIEDAIALLRFSNRGAARDIRKLIESAAANAEANHELVADDLVIKDIHVDEGPTLRRYRPRALGRATRINKRTSHIAVALTPEE